MAEPHELSVPLRAHNSDLKARRSAERLILEHGTATLRARVTPVKIDGQTRIIRRDGLRNLLTKRVEKIRQTELLAPQRLFCEIDEAFSCLGTFCAAIITNDLVSLS